MTGQLDARLRRTRTALRDALLHLLNSKNFDQISVREVTALARISYATFYRHYASREELLQELADWEVKNILEIALPLIFTASMRDSHLALCARVDRNRGLWRAMLTGPASGVLREEFINQVSLLKGHYDVGSSWMPEELHLICATGGTIDVLTWWLKHEPGLAVSEVVDILGKLLDALAGRGPAAA